MKLKNSKPLSSLIFIPILSLIFIRPFISGLAYPLFEFYYENLIILIAIITLLTLNKPRRLPTATYAVGVVLLAYIISTITSVNINNSFKETLKFLSYISVFFAVFQASPDQKKILIKTIVIAAVLISAYAIYQYFWGYQHTLDYLKKVNSQLLLSSSYAKDILIAKRAIGTFPSPNILGGYLIMMFFLSMSIPHPTSGVGHLAHSRSGMRFIAPAALILALILTKSLGAWLSLIACLIILFFISYNNFKNKKLLFTVSMIFTTSVLIFIIINRWERLMNLENPQNSITQRLNYWRIALAVIKDHPFLGVGPGNFQEVFLKYKVGLNTDTRYAHNIFLHMWAETGVLGFIGTILLIVTLITRSISKSRYLFLASMAFLLHNLIDNAYFIPEVGVILWVLAALFC